MHENLGRGKKIPSKTIQKDYGHFMLFCTVRENSKMATFGVQLLLLRQYPQSYTVVPYLPLKDANEHLKGYILVLKV